MRNGCECINNTRTVANPKTVKGRPMLWGGERAFFPLIKGLAEIEKT